MDETLDLLERIASSLEGIESQLGAIEDALSGLQSQNGEVVAYLESISGEFNWLSPTSAIAVIKTELESISNR